MQKNWNRTNTKKLIENLTGISNQVGFNVIDYSNDEIVPVKDLNPESQKIVVFDDYVTENNQLFRKIAILSKIPFCEMNSL